MKLSKKFLSRLILFIILLLGLTNPNNPIDALLSFSLFVYVGLITAGFGQNQVKINSYPLVLPIVAVFVITSFVNSSQLRTFLSREPITETYRTDMDDFLKTHYLMEKGSGYYPSFKMAVEQNAFKTQISNNLWSWRLPTVFYFWNLLPGASGISIYSAFVILCAVTLYISWGTVRQLLKAEFQSFAILGPYLLYPYLHFAARDPTMLQTEWWAIFPMFTGIYFIVKDKPIWATILFTVAILIRELFVIPLLFLTILTAFQKSKNCWIYALPIFVLGFFLIFHARQVTGQVNLTQNLFIPRLQGGKEIVLATLAFGSWEYFFYKLRLFAIFFVIGLVGIIRLIKNKVGVGWVLFSFFIFPVSFLVLGSSVYNDYWGIFYMPFVLISLPLILENKS